MAREKVWEAARTKVDQEGRCRVCKRTAARVWALEAAHTIGQKYQDTEIRHFDLSRDEWWVNPDSVIPLCKDTDGGCHGKYDAHKLDILPYITNDEQADAVAAVGIDRALRRLTSGLYEIKEVA